MKNWIRIGQVGLSFILLFLALAFFVRMEWALGLWPWAGYYSSLSPLSAIFLSSILAAVATPMLWIGLSGTESASVSGAVDLAISSVGTAIFMFQSYFSSGDSRLLTAAIVISLLFVFTIVVAIINRKEPLKHPGGVPLPIRISFSLFVVVLIVVGGALALKMPRIFPWAITTEMSVVYGWIFLGAAVYFLLGVLRPSQDNTLGQLIGFLAYDIILIVPFLQHFPSVDPDLRLNLVIYIVVLVYSGALSIYYLFLHAPTRIIRKVQPGAA